MYQNIATKCLTGEVRLSYAHLCEPYSSNGGEPKYSVTLLIPKTDTATYNDLKNALGAAYELGVADKWKGNRPQMRYPVIYDGDGVRPSGEPFGDECKGCWVVTASSKQKPTCVHISNVHAELLPSDIYSGMYARVTVNFFPYNSNGNRGVGCGLGNVCKTRDGDPLSGRATAENDFAGIEQAAPAAIPQTGFQPPFAGTAPAVNPITGLPMA